MNRKLTAAAPAFVFLVVQAPIAWALHNAVLAAQRNWSAVLGSGRPLPLLTDLAFRFGFVMPLVMAFVAAAFLIVCLRNQPISPLWLVIPTSCELVALAFFAFGIVKPALYIQY